ncbi:alpha/beta hydrolase [Actinomycetospora sp. NBRC 106378]|uniref:alpha/beta fold hydrolase n=1 Tax=Actinomycetospora sp. NBRC 106378 TaxID=3032208 RepID=UPI0024A53A58|nr:alpha/beta hydrolase [Actinomycetospora sp. NBRC 106378]GLZ53681.1 oxidoreductase [Actinomycetospora sp. NBRC 106378]
MNDTAAYADVNGLHLYHEVHGNAGTPLVLLHGGLLNIEIAFRDLIPGLATRHRVIAVELQGHGRTADIDREITPANSAADVVALLDHLGIGAAHVLGHSMGGAVAMELAVSHPDRVLSVVAASVTVRPEGMHPDLMDSAKHATSDRMPTAEDFTAMSETYARLSPHPDHFQDFMTTLSSSAADLRGWSDEALAGITAPVLFVQGDRDFTTLEHAALMVDLVAGSQLAILPGTTHMQVTGHPALPVLLEGFLA